MQTVIFLLQLLTHCRIAINMSDFLMELVIDHMLIINGIEQSVGCHVTQLKQ